MGEKGSHISSLLSLACPAKQEVIESPPIEEED
jgi:hypothetical protein